MQPMHPKTTRAMAAAYGFDASKNAEIRGSWYRLCLQAGVPQLIGHLHMHIFDVVRSSNSCSTGRRL